MKSGEHEVTVDVTTESTYFGFAVNIFAQTENVLQKNFFDEHIKNGVFLDFPIQIKGEGTNSSLVLKTRHYDSLSGTETIFGGFFIIAGSVFNKSGSRTNQYHSRLELGDITISDLAISSGLDTSLGSDKNSTIFIIDHSNLKLLGPFPVGYRESFIKINGCYAEKIFFSEISDLILSKGNLVINDCVLKSSLNFFKS